MPAPLWSCAGILILALSCVMMCKKLALQTQYQLFMHHNWKGIYELSGKSEYLNFLYDVGIGAKNSQGFGMFDVMDN